MTYRRHNHDNIHVRGYKEEGTTTTPFDMVVLNNLDRYQLALDAIRRIPRLSDQVQKATARYWTTMERHKLYVSEHGDDMPEVRAPQIPMTSRFATIIPQEFCHRLFHVGVPTEVWAETRERQTPDWRSQGPSIRYFLAFFFRTPFFAARSSITACAAASRAIGTRNGDALT